MIRNAEAVLLDGTEHIPQAGAQLGPATQAATQRFAPLSPSLVLAKLENLGTAGQMCPGLDPALSFALLGRARQAHTPQPKAVRLPPPVPPFSVSLRPDWSLGACGNVLK
eukprot:2860288-Rhodomonas_salina.6